MKGRFRKRSEAVWCPKPKERIDYSKFDMLKYIEKIKSMSLKEEREFNKTLPKKMLSRTGWINLSHCDDCAFLEEFHIDGEGVFCLYGIKEKILNERKVN